MPSGTRWCVVASPRQQLVTDAVIARLATTGFIVYRAEVATTVPVQPATGRIAPYLVAYPFGKAGGPDPDLGDSTNDLTYTVQVTCVAGFSADTEYVVDQVNGILNRWTPTVTGMVCGTLRPPPGYDPGPVRPDYTVTPPRFWVPLQYRTTVTT